MKLGPIVLRAALGAVFFAHGAQKLFGWFGGYGLEATANAFDSMGLKPGKRSALIAGGSETGAGVLFAAGFMTPLAAATSIAVQNEAIRTVHWEKGFFSTDGGYEFNLTLIAAAIALADSGPGPLSLDRALGTERSGTLWALAALGAGLVGPRLLDRIAPPPAESAAPAPAPQGDGRAQEVPDTVASSR
ncbi:MAG TPA: DoxX family protein [Solirubrobacteraceae bacterium]|nr:DoxX family protein [Solirubrobacteraceae bacterium]